MTSITRSNLLYHQEEDDCYFSHDQPSYYKRSNLIPTSSFRQKFSRTRSYATLENQDKKKSANNTTTTTGMDFIPTSPFSRKKLGMTGERSATAPAIILDNTDLEEEEESDDSDENTFFAKKSNYSRQNLRSSPSSWKSCVLRAVGVKSSK